jgi:hypothetical protein
MIAGHPALSVWPVSVFPVLVFFIQLIKEPPRWDW